MPRSKRNIKVTLTKVGRKGPPLKEKLITEVQSAAEKYDRVFTLHVHNMRNMHMVSIRNEWKDSRFIFGKNKVMKLALGTGPESEHLDGLHLVGKQLNQQMGLLFTNKKKADVVKFFQKHRFPEYARSGNVATKTVKLKAGPIKFQHSHTIEPQLRQLGLPTVLVKGVVTLREDHTVCKKGEKLTPEKSHILKLFGYTMADFYVTPTGMWTKAEGKFTSFKSKSKKDKAMEMENKSDEEAEEDDEDQEEEDDDEKDNEEENDDDEEEMSDG